MSRKSKLAKLSPALQPVEKMLQPVDSTVSPMIKDEIDKAEIPRPETRSDGYDEPSDLEEALQIVPLTLSKKKETSRETSGERDHIFRMFASNWTHVIHQNLVLTLMSHGLETIVGTAF